MSGVRPVGIVCVTGAIGAAGLAAYLFFAQPIGFAECGRLAQELTHPECRNHGPAVAVVTLVAVAIVLAVVGVRANRRT